MFYLLTVWLKRLFKDVQWFEVSAVDEISSTRYKHVPKDNRGGPTTAHTAHFRHAQFAEDQYVV